MFVEKNIDGMINIFMESNKCWVIAKKHFLEQMMAELINV